VRPSFKLVREIVREELALEQTDNNPLDDDEAGSELLGTSVAAIHTRLERLDDTPACAAESASCSS
jgi:hypothetical protein